jgi:hypothetical protein
MTGKEPAPECATQWKAYFDEANTERKIELTPQKYAVVPRELEDTGIQSYGSALSSHPTVMSSGSV